MVRKTGKERGGEGRVGGGREESNTERWASYRITARVVRKTGRERGGWTGRRRKVPQRDFLR